ncbi:hypothetical protein B0H16DRAFT_1756623 [Mycena metata]|uniref:BTB domain-containing protein n=1 Tax=Mycena metata TaxID=1033252 RepID=A0AAD7JZZ7_9AGAR|nr:hypothetical protein B0H16DRAFT_1756623 [Mycena metata]
MSTPASDTETPSVSSKFNPPDADITFKSPDGVLFHIHRRNLEVSAEGFPPGEISTNGSIVELAKMSATLELLFHFMYPQRQPTLETTPFEVLNQLAEAAEKYQVFHAMNIWYIRMKYCVIGLALGMVQQHPGEVAVYAAKHDYPDLLCEAAPLIISLPPVEVIEILPPDLARYVQEWADVLTNDALLLPTNFTVSRHSTAWHGKPYQCSWAQYLLTITQRLGAGVHSLRSLDAMFDMSTPPVSCVGVEKCCQKEFGIWRLQIEEGIAEIPKFDIFL